MTKVVFKVVKFLELFIVVKIKQTGEKIELDVMEICQTRKEATHKIKLYDFINDRTAAELKKIIEEQEAI